MDHKSIISDVVTPSVSILDPPFNQKPQNLNRLSKRLRKEQIHLYYKLLQYIIILDVRALCRGCVEYSCYTRAIKASAADVMPEKKLE